MGNIRRDSGTSEDSKVSYETAPFSLESTAAAVSLCGNSLRNLDISAVNTNGIHEKVSVSDGNHCNFKSSNSNINDPKIEKVPTVNGFPSVKMLANGIVAFSEKLINGSSDSESHINGSVNKLQNSSNALSDSENPNEFIEVVHKKKKRQNKQRKYMCSSLPGPSISSKSDKRNKNIEKKTCIPTSQKPPNSNFSTVRSSGKSYSSVLLNGQSTNANTKLPKDVKKTVNVQQTNFSWHKAKISTSDVSAQTENNSSPEISDSTINKNSSNENQSLLAIDKKTLESVAIINGSSFENVAKEEIVSRNLQVIDKTNEIAPAKVQKVGDDFSDENSTTQEVNSESPNAAATKNMVEDCFGAEGGELDINAADYQGAEGGELDVNVAHVNEDGSAISDVIYNKYNPFFCEFAKSKIGSLIGRGGTFKNQVESYSGATFWVCNEVSVDEETTVISFRGTGVQIEKAKDMIRRRFKDATLKNWIQPRVVPTMQDPPTLCANFYIPSLPICTNFNGVVTYAVNPHHFYIQLYGHPYFPKLEQLESNMANDYNKNKNVPKVDDLNIGSIIAVPMEIEGSEAVQWRRAEVLEYFHEEQTVLVRHLDYGNIVEIPVDDARPMLNDFLSIPFMATPCTLAGTGPAKGDWTDEACNEFRKLCFSSALPPIFNTEGRLLDGRYIVNMFGYYSDHPQANVAYRLMECGLAVLHTGAC